jgi:hypothetical protein
MTRVDINDNNQSSNRAMVLLKGDQFGNIYNMQGSNISDGRNSSIIPFGKRMYDFFIDLISDNLCYFLVITTFLGQYLKRLKC